jgi:uncharacterized protein (DUF4415 family)
MESRKSKPKVRRRPLTNRAGEVRELTARDAALAVPFPALPQAEQATLLAINNEARKRGPQKAPRKVPISIRLSPDVAEGLRATGEGWQSRADEVLRSWLASAER